MNSLPRDVLSAIQRFLPFEDGRHLRDVNRDFYALFARRCGKLTRKTAKGQENKCDDIGEMVPPSHHDYFEKAFDKYFEECAKKELAKNPQHLKANYAAIYFGKRTEWFKLDKATRDVYIRKVKNEEEICHSAAVFLYGEWWERSRMGLI